VVLLALRLSNLSDDAVKELIILALHEVDGVRGVDGAVASDLALELTLLFSKAMEELVGIVLEGLSASVILELTDDQRVLDAGTVLPQLLDDVVEVCSWFLTVSILLHHIDMSLMKEYVVSDARVEIIPALLHGLSSFK
jgi:hypothetical protein